MICSFGLIPSRGALTNNKSKLPLRAITKKIGSALQGAVAGQQVASDSQYKGSPHLTKAQIYLPAGIKIQNSSIHLITLAGTNF